MFLAMKAHSLPPHTHICRLIEQLPINILARECPTMTLSAKLKGSGSFKCKEMGKTGNAATLLQL